MSCRRKGTTNEGCGKLPVLVHNAQNNIKYRAKLGHTGKLYYSDLHAKVPY